MTRQFARPGPFQSLSGPDRAIPSVPAMSGFSVNPYWARSGQAGAARAGSGGTGNWSPGRVAHRSAEDGSQLMRAAVWTLGVSAVRDVVGGGGQPLEESVRTEMESRLGQDFSGVRIHT